MRRIVESGKAGEAKRLRDETNYQTIFPLQSPGTKSAIECASADIRSLITGLPLLPSPCYNARMTAASDPSSIIAAMATSARLAQSDLSVRPKDVRPAALNHAADALDDAAETILAANAHDRDAAGDNGMSDAMLDRLELTGNRLAAMTQSIRRIAELPDPVGAIIDRTSRPNGLELCRIRVPIGVLGIVYESRPNVTADAAALSIMSGNAAILRGGSEAVHSNRAIHAAFCKGLERAEISADIVQSIPTRDRALVGAMLTASGAIDMIIPRGGKGLIVRVQADARVPVLAHLDGICHTYVHRDASLEMACAVVVNAKMRRTGVCGAMETLLLDARFAGAGGVVTALIKAGCILRGDPRVCAIDPRIEPARQEDWDTEYLAPILSMRIVDGLDEAIAHIARHGSGHTDAIVTDNAAIAEQFLNRVDSAIVMHNTSSQFADGGEFGLGAEIGIATGRLHARGPVALEGLTTYKWQVRGTGQVRPA